MSQSNNFHAIKRPLVLVTNSTQILAIEMIKQFITMGFDLVLTDKSESLFDLKKNLSCEGTSIEAFQLNLKEKTDRIRFEENLVHLNRPIDILLLNGTDNIEGPFLDSPFDEEEKFITENLLELLFVLKKILPAMYERNHGKIFFPASLGPCHGAPFEAVTGATRSFVLSFMTGLRTELKETRITLTTLLPSLEQHFSFNSHKNFHDPVWLASECFEAIMSSRQSVFEGNLTHKMENFFRHSLFDKVFQLIMS